MKMVEANAGKMEAQLRNWGAKLDKVMARAEAAGTAVETEYHKGVDDLKAKYKVAQSRFAECKAAGSEKWGVFQTDLATAWNDLETAFRRLGKSALPTDVAQPGEAKPS